MAGFMKKMFRGMETPAEEKKEAKALKAGKITPKQYVAGEKSEGHGAGAAKKAAAIKSGKLSPAKYAAEHKEKAMKCGGKVKRMMFGGIANAVGNAAQKAIARQPAAGGKPATPSMAGGATAAGPAKGSVGLTGGPKPSPIRNQPIGTAPTAVKKTISNAAGRGASPVSTMQKLKGLGVPLTNSKMAKGGGVEAKGKTAGKTVKMAKGGGVEVKGKTKGRMC